METSQTNFCLCDRCGNITTLHNTTSPLFKPQNYILAVKANVSREEEKNSSNNNPKRKEIERRKEKVREKKKL